MSMILAKLSNIKSHTKENIKNDSKKLQAIKSVNEIISKIDFSVEEIPINNAEKLTVLLTSLKGGSLVKKEIELVKEIVEKRS